MTDECRDIMFHQGCMHGGWVEVQPFGAGRTMEESSRIVHAAREMANLTCTDLGLGVTVALRFFKPAPLVPCADDRIAYLHVGAYDPTMMGKAAPPTLDRPGSPAVWIRAGVSPAATAFLVAHEVRRLWHELGRRPGSLDRAAEDSDCSGYASRAILRFPWPFTREELRTMLEEVGFEGRRRAS